MSNSNSKSKKSTKLQIRQRRVFSDEFKREKVDQILNCEYSIASFCKLWSVSSVTVYKWIRHYSPEHKKGTTMVIQKDSEASKTNELLRQVSELERGIGQKQMQIDFLEKLIELASKELDVDIKKKFSAKP